MDRQRIHHQLRETCLALGANYVMDEAEGEIRATVIRGAHWWNLILSDQVGDDLWHQQLALLRHQA